MEYAELSRLLNSRFGYGLVFALFVLGVITIYAFFSSSIQYCDLRVETCVARCNSLLQKCQEPNLNAPEWAWNTTTLNKSAWQVQDYARGGHHV